MLRRPLLVNLAIALTATAFIPMTVSAQERDRERSRGSVSGRATDTREVQEDYRRPSRQDRGAAAAPTTGPEVLAAAQGLVSTLGLSCQVGNAASPGTAADGSNVYEVACDAGPGYIIVASTPPTSNNCLVLSESARRAQAADPNAATGIQCTLPENNNALAVLAAYAAAASVPCQVDAGVWRGRTTDGADRYEVGCAGADGYWIEVASTGAIANTIDCLEVVRAGQTCEFTTTQEQIATIRAKVEGSSAPACDIQQAVSRGANANGRFYEVKCADNSGYIFRTSAEGVMAEAFPCLQATHIAGGCQLTDISGVVQAQAQSRLEQVTALGFPCAVTQEAMLGRESSGQMRELYEFQCSDRPLGVIAFFPTQGTGEVAAMDCLSVRVRGSSCRFTTEDQLKAVMTSMLSAGGTPCTVEDYAAIAPMDDDSGEFMEVKCSDGRGLLANFPATRTATSGRVLTCSQAATRDYECVI
jgi:ribosomal protein S27E